MITEPLKRSDKLNLYDYIYEICTDSDNPFENVYVLNKIEENIYIGIHVITGSEFKLDLQNDDITNLYVLRIPLKVKKMLGFPVKDSD